MDRYYFKEKIYNILGILLTLLFIFQGWQLIFNPAQIGVIILVRVFFMKTEGRLQSALLLFILYAGYLWEYNYFIIHYFEYILLLFFFGFLIYNICSSSSNKKRDVLIAALGIAILLCINIYNINNRLFADPQLNKIVNNKYQFQFITESKPTKQDPRLERITDLDIRSKWSVKTLNGIENLPNLKNLEIDDQDKLLNYNSLAHLNNLSVLHVWDSHTDFSINLLPELKHLETLSINLGMNKSFNDEILDLKKFPKLKRLYLSSLDDDKPITIDIRNNPNLEIIDVLMNVEKIIGLEEAKNLKEIDIYPDEMNYIEEVKKLRPDIDIRR